MKKLLSIALFGGLLLGASRAYAYDENQIRYLYGGDDSTVSSSVFFDSRNQILKTGETKNLLYSTLTCTPWTTSATEKALVLPTNTVYLKVSLRPGVATTNFVDAFFATGLGSKSGGAYVTVGVPLELSFAALGSTGGTLYLDADGNVDQGLAANGLVSVCYGTKIP